MRAIIISLIILLELVISLKVSAVTTAEADSAYSRGDYSKAIELYDELIKEQGVSAEILYNLGNSWYQEGDNGKAMLNYQKARKLSPSNKIINNNIRFLEGKIQDANKAEQGGKRLKVTEDAPSFFRNVHNAIARDTDSNVWAVWGAICFFSFIICAGIYIYTKNVVARKIGFFGALAFISFTVICVLFSFMGAAVYNSQDEGILTDYKTILYSEANVSDPNITKKILVRGTKVDILDYKTDAAGKIIWYKVRLNSDFIGWVQSGSLEII